MEKDFSMKAEDPRLEGKEDINNIDYRTPDTYNGAVLTYRKGYTYLVLSYSELIDEGKESTQEVIKIYCEDEKQAFSLAKRIIELCENAINKDTTSKSYSTVENDRSVDGVLTEFVRGLPNRKYSLRPGDHEY